MICGDVMNMIEKVARSICARELEITDSDQTAEWRSHMVNELWPEWVPHVEDALQVIKEPTPEMLNAAHECTVAGCCLVGQEQALDVWEEMIQTALDGK